MKPLITSYLTRRLELTHRISITVAAAIFALAAVLCPTPSAQASFGFLPGDAGFQVSATENDGSPATRAGSHPFALTTEIGFELDPASAGEPGGPFSDGDLRDLRIELPPGLIENPEALPRCTQAQFHAPRESPFEASLSGESCPAKSQIGTVEVHSSYGGGSVRTFGVFNLVPPPGFPSQIGTSPYGMSVAITPSVRETGREYGLNLSLRDFPQRLDLKGLRLTIWGVPWSFGHNGERGNCLNEAEPAFPHAKCSVGPPSIVVPQAYLTLPSSCEAPIAFRIAASSWGQPGEALATAVGSDRNGVPRALAGCDSLPFLPEPLARLDTRRAASPGGFELRLQGNSKGLLDPLLRAGAQTKRAILRLPEGVTVNPSLGAGLGVCSPAQYAAETASSPPGAGCPNASKIGELTVKSPLFEGAMDGALFLAEPDDPATAAGGAENPFDSLLALYLVAKAAGRGVMVRLAGEVSADPGSGRLTVSFDDLPQLPYEDLLVHLRNGQRSALATPPACGDHLTETDLSPWLDPGSHDLFTTSSPLETGIGGGPCPPAAAPFRPAAEAGTRNRNAGSYTPFYLHLTRGDEDQEIVSYSALLPPGLTGKLAGIRYCPEAAIAAAKLRSGVAEQRRPSCPESTRIGRTVSGYGLSSVLAYAPGGLYLAGPYHGAPFSIVAIDSATVGPFDLGVVVVRSAIRVDPRTAQVSVDSAGSDPIPHILRGIPIHLRDVRVYVDRPGLTLNPTSCERLSAVSTLGGSGRRFADPADDTGASLPSLFQVSNCSALGFKPRLGLRLRGGTGHGDYPSLRAVVRPRPGDANIGRAAVTLPPSLFLAQEHIGTVCTRAQFAAHACPPGSVYGQATALTPLLGVPLRGPVYLRASDNPLPDLVAAIEGQGIEIEVVGRIDSYRGGIRASFDVLPDAPVSRFTMTLRGGSHGPLVNAADFCDDSAFALARFAGQNNRGVVLRPPIRARCPGAAGKRQRAGERGRR